MCYRKNGRGLGARAEAWGLQYRSCHSVRGLCVRTLITVTLFGRHLIFHFADVDKSTEGSSNWLKFDRKGMRLPGS